eukprot:12064339-Alexandrium_andersonii.AAC.1
MKLERAETRCDTLQRHDSGVAWRGWLVWRRQRSYASLWLRWRCCDPNTPSTNDGPGKILRCCANLSPSPRGLRYPSAPPRTDLCRWQPRKCTTVFERPRANDYVQECMRKCVSESLPVPDPETTPSGGLGGTGRG